MSGILRRTPRTATGLSVLAGDPVRAAEDLPAYAVEMHRFRSSDAAAAFVAGLEASGAGNRLAWTWEPGEDEGANRTVLLVRFDQERRPGATLEDAVRVVGHDGTVHDQRARAAAERRMTAERRRADHAIEKRSRALREAAERAGLSVGSWGADWARIAEVDVVERAEGFVASVSDGHHDTEPEDLRARFAPAAPAGVVYDDEERRFATGPFATAEEVVASVPLLRRAAEVAEEVRRRWWRERFVASMRMTAARRRFLAAADREGKIHVGYPRMNLVARAGGETVKATEFERLKSMGWIEMVGRLEARITPAGRVAAGLVEADPEAPGP